MNAISPISDAQFVAAMKSAPAGQFVIQAERARTIAERQRLIDELAALEADATKTFPRLRKVVEAEIASERAAEHAFRDASEKRRLAALAVSGASATYDAARRQREDKLRDTAAAKVIDQFQRDMRDEIDAAMKRHEGGMFHESRPLARDPAERMLRHSYGNRASVSARLDAIHAATAEAERLRLVADQTDLAARLDALRAGLPAIVGAVYPAIGGAAA